MWKTKSEDEPSAPTKSSGAAKAGVGAQNADEGSTAPDGSEDERVSD